MSGRNPITGKLKRAVRRKVRPTPAIDPKAYCGIVFIGGGSSWHYAPTIDGAAQTAARQARDDWGRVFKFEKKQPFTVNVYDMREHSGWHASAEGVFAQGTNVRLTPVATVSVTLTC